MTPISHENRIDILRLKALVLEKENQIFATRLVELQKKYLELLGASPEQLQQELGLLEKELQQAAKSLQKKLAETEPHQEEPEKEEQKGAENKEKKKRKRSGPTPQPNLEIIPVLHDFDEADKCCRDCGLPNQPWDGQEDKSDEIVLIERKFVIHHHIRKKRICKCGTLEMASMPPKVVPGGRYSNSVALETAAMKFVDQIPYDRTAKIFGREGLAIDSQTLWDQVNALARLLEPAYERLKKEALKRPVVGIDQSHWKVIGHAKTWQMWELSTSDICYFVIAKTKSAEDGIEIIAGFVGTLVCDALATHGAMLPDAPGVKLAHCWAHPLRAAKEAKASDPLRAHQLLKFIRALYAIDKRAENLEQLRELRNTRSRRVLKKLWEWIERQRILPSFPLAKILQYLKNHKEGLERFLEDPRIPLDNNQTERGYVWPAIGRRAFVGSRSERGTQVAALFYSLAESARRNGLDPRGYYKTAMEAALEKRTIPLPHEIAAEAKARAAPD